MTKPENKKWHDLTGALRSLELAVQSIRRGYRFDDDMAESKIKTMEKSVEILKRELELLLGSVP